VKENIMIVDDEVEIADLVELYLKNEGYNVYKYYNGADGLRCVRENSLSLAILDVMLPDIDGFAMCQEIRRTHYFPIIMLTARVEDIDKINGLAIGADDYITKPFNPLEVVARVKAQLRRYARYDSAASPEAPRDEIDIRGLHIDNVSHKCSINGRELVLTPTEFKILLHLCRNRGGVVTSEELFEAVWQEKYYDSNNTVMAHISRLRQKMKDTGRQPKYIKTVWGVGYTVE
jgi:two-component system response regulator VanR